MLTGHALDLFARGILEPGELTDWAQQLLTDGRDSEAILLAAANSDLHWEDVNRYFVQICRDLGLSQNIELEMEAVIRKVWFEEYRRGMRRGAEVLQKFEDVREKIGFPEPVIFRLMEDNPDGTNESGYYGWESGICGQELEESIRKHFVRAGFLGDT